MDIVVIDAVVTIRKKLNVQDINYNFVDNNLSKRKNIFSKLLNYEYNYKKI
jgi:hypothetical protein